MTGGCGEAASTNGTRTESPTIVSLNPCTDAILAEVAPGTLLAISHYSHDPRASSMDIATARRFAVTGGTVEEVLALDPDIVVAGSFLAPATRSALDDLGVRVETFGIASSVADSIAQVRRLADLSGEEAAGEDLVGQIEAAVRPIDTPRMSAVLWQPGGIVPGSQTLVTELLERAGYESHSVARGLGQAAYLPLEQVVADPPDLLLVAGHDTGQRHPILDAVPDMRRATFDPGLLYCGGPTIIRAMYRLREVRPDRSVRVEPFGWLASQPLRTGQGRDTLAPSQRISTTALGFARSSARYERGGA